MHKKYTEALATLANIGRTYIFREEYIVLDVLLVKINTENKLQTSYLSGKNNVSALFD